MDAVQADGAQRTCRTRCKNVLWCTVSSVGTRVTLLTGIYENTVGLLWFALAKYAHRPALLSPLFSSPCTFGWKDNVLLWRNCQRKKRTFRHQVTLDRDWEMHPYRDLVSGRKGHCDGEETSWTQTQCLQTAWAGMKGKLLLALLAKSNIHAPCKIKFKMD